MTNSDSIHKALLSRVIKGEGFFLPDFVNRVQGFNLGLRLTHWETTSYELHKAVETTQESLEGLLDDFVEACIGKDEGKRPSFQGTVTKELDPDSFLDFLSSVSIKDTDLLNIRDEMLQVVHKFKYLKTLN
jgi:hypothetical protein